jgi:hypothetical protein
MMETNFTEFEILKELDEKFTTLDQDAQQRAIDWIIAKYKLTHNKENASKKNDTSNHSKSSELTLKDFILHKKPIGHYERIACIAFYLEKTKGMEGCKTVDITNANSEARQPKIPNTALYVNHTTNTYGYLISIGNAKKGISARGEALVDALPDREKVATALKEHSIKKKPAKKSKTK